MYFFSFYKTYIIGILWFLLHLTVSVSNDAIAKFLGNHLPPAEITFLRFIFGALSLLPIIAFYGINTLKTSHISVHIIRGVLLFIGINLWVWGLSIVPMASVTMINFTVPMFVLVLALIFLKEKIALRIWVATIAGFIGVYITLDPHSLKFDPSSLVLVVGALMFASLDIINKKFVVKETMIGMLFYPSIVTIILGIWPAYQVWVTPTTYELMLMLALGIGSNLVLFCILKAFALLDASSFSPYRYLELVLSSGMGYLLFAEIPSTNILLGCAIIIPASFYIAVKSFAKPSELAIN